MSSAKASILICSRNGGAKLQRMLESVNGQNEEIDEIILLDDGSDPPLANPGRKAKLLRHAKSRGLITSRNELAREARNEFMFFFDDDACLDDPQAIKNAADIMAADATVGAVAFLQRRLDGTIPDLQPVHGGSVRQIANYFGWAHLIRRSAWEKVGPFAEIFQYGYEELEFSLRLLDAGYKVMGDPALSVIHDSAEHQKKNPRRYFLNTRNMFLTYLLRYPRNLAIARVKNGLRTVPPYPFAPESPWLFRIRLAFALAAKLPYIAAHRKAISSEALETYAHLLDSACPANKTSVAVS